MAEPELSAGVVVIRRDPDRCRFLLLRAYTYWDFPKGLVAPGETALAAARREVAEETGITDLTFPWGDGSYRTEPYRGGRKVARYFAGETRAREAELPVSPDLGRPEHHEVRWVTREEARALLSERVAAALQWAADRAGCGG